MIFSNPIAIQGRLAQCWLFAYQTSIESAQSLLPRELELVTHRGHAFWNIVVSEITGLRPVGAPAALGLRYCHVAYRLYARAHPVDSEPVEGLYFVRSDCNSRLMHRAGNLLTPFRFHYSPIAIQHDDTRTQLIIRSREAEGSVLLNAGVPIARPPHSVFETPEAAAAALKYKPCGISVPKRGHATLVRITRDESQWNSQPVPVVQAAWSFLKDQSVQLEVCAQIAPIDYQWNRSETVKVVS